jgi:NAD(P)-dependent dehydrogenase (short-subunit alcohol dehydrogenase family)
VIKLQDKFCLVTGANKGIGKATAVEIARLGAKVVLVCRDEVKGQAAKKEIIQKTGNKRVDLMICDFARLSSVRQLAHDIKGRFQQLDVLINNTAIFVTKLIYTEDEFEMQFQVNHLSPFLLTNLLLNLMKKSAPSRIINVASDAHYAGRIHFENPSLSDGYHGMKAYRQSKLANVLFTYELAKRLNHSGVTTNCLHPGVVRTSLIDRHSSGLYKYGWILMKPFLIPVTQGAKTSVYLATSDEVYDVSGKYFDKCKSKKSSTDSYNPDIALKLWKISEKLTDLKNSI